MKLWTILKMSFGGAIVGLVVMLIANFITGQDEAAAIAGHLGLGNGVIVGVLLGALLAGWISWGGQRRIAGYLGWMLAILVVWLLWRITRPYFWVVDVTLASIFGREAAIFGGVVVFVLLFAIFRWVSYQAFLEILVLLQKINPPKEAVQMRPGGADTVQ